MRHVLTAQAYERKESLGGGFRGVVYHPLTKQRDESPVLPTIDAARHWARSRVFEIMGEKPWRPGYIYRPTWRMNVFAA